MANDQPLNTSTVYQVFILPKLFFGAQRKPIFILGVSCVAVCFLGFETLNPLCFIIAVPGLIIGVNVLRSMAEKDPLLVGIIWRHVFEFMKPVYAAKNPAWRKK